MRLICTYESLVSANYIDPLNIYFAHGIIEYAYSGTETTLMIFSDAVTHRREVSSGGLIKVIRRQE